MIIKTDTHTHTFASGHAYSSIEDNARQAAENGLEAIGITDHFSGLFFDASDYNNYAHFMNYSALPECWHGVRVLHGAEADIVTLDGQLFGHDLKTPFEIPGLPPQTYEQSLLNKLDYVIASVHDRKFVKDASLVQTTEMYCKALHHPKVLIIGHIGRSQVPFDIDEVLLTAKSLNKMIELNESTFGYPENITDICQTVAERCAELDVKVSIGSDAHSAFYVGHFKKIPQMLEKIHFPQHLIGNATLASLEEMIELSGVRSGRI